MDRKGRHTSEPFTAILSHLHYIFSHSFTGLQGTGVDRVCVVVVARVDRRIFKHVVKNGFVVEERSLKVTTAAGTNAPLSQRHAWLGPTQYAVQLAKHTYTQCVH